MSTTTRVSKRIAPANAKTVNAGGRTKKVKKYVTTATSAPPTKSPGAPKQGTRSDSDDSSIIKSDMPPTEVVDRLNLLGIAPSVLEPVKPAPGIAVHMPPLPTNYISASVPPPMLATNSVSASGVPSSMDFVSVLPPKTVFLSGMLSSYGNLAEAYNVNYFTQVSLCAYDSIMVRACLFSPNSLCYKSCGFGLNTDCVWFIFNNFGMFWTLWNKPYIYSITSHPPLSTIALSALYAYIYCCCSISWSTSSK